MTVVLAFNILAACGAATLAGVLLNVGLGFGRYWLTLTPSEFLDWFSANSQFVPGGVVVAMVPTVVGLAGSLWLGWSDGRQRTLWIAALLCIVGLLALTAAFQGPANHLFIAKAVPPEQVSAALHRWLAIHAVRIALALGAAILGLVAVAHSHSPRP